MKTYVKTWALLYGTDQTMKLLPGDSDRRKQRLFMFVVQRQTGCLCAVTRENRAWWLTKHDESKVNSEFWLFYSLKSDSNWSISDRRGCRWIKSLTASAAVNESTMMLDWWHFSCVSDRSWWKYVQFLSLKMEAGPELSFIGWFHTGR